MSLTTMKQVRLEVDSGADYAANGIATIKLNQLGSLSRTGKDGKGHTLIVGIGFRVRNLVIANASGGALTFAHEKLHDIIQAVTLDIGGWRPFHLPTNGGQMLRQIRRLLGIAGGLVEDPAAVNNGASTPALVVEFLLPFFDPRTENPNDFAFPARAAKDGVLQVQYANGAAAGEFGAGVSVTSATIEAFAILTTVDHFRMPPKWGFMEKKLNSLQESSQIPAGYKYLDVALCAVHSASSHTTNYFTTTEVDTIDYVEDDDQICRKAKPAVLVTNHNVMNVQSPDAKLARFDDTGTPKNDLIPIKTIPARAGLGQLTKGASLSASPSLDITGTLTVADAELLLHWIKPVTPREVVKGMVAADLKPSAQMVANPAKFVKGATAYGGDAIRAKEQWLSQKLLPKGRRPRSAPGS